MLLPLLGVDSSFLVNRHGPCPMCGGADRFRWDNSSDRGDFICNQCGAGDGFALAGHVTGKPFSVIAQEVEKILGIEPERREAKGDPEERKRRMAIESVWKGSRPVSEDCPVGVYLKKRTGALMPFEEIRWHPNFMVDQVRYSAMLCRVRDTSGEAVNIHVTVLTDEGEKADVAVPKRVMSGKLPAGSAIRLGPTSDTMGVAEGVETAISASVIAGFTVWSCLNAGMLSKWEPPPDVRRVVVFPDNDKNFAGQASAYALANRLFVKHNLRVDVAIPPQGKDWNDYHKIKMART